MGNVLGGPVQEPRPTARTRQNQLRTELEAERTARIAFQAQVGQLQQQLAAAQAEAGQLQQRLGAAETRATQLEHERNAARARLDLAEEEAARVPGLQQQIQGLNGRVDQLQGIVDVEQASRIETAVTLEATTAARDRALQHEAELLRQNGELQQRLEAARAAQAAAEARATQLEEQRDAAREARDAAELQVGRLQNQLAVRTADDARATQLQQDLNAERSEHARTRAQRDQLQAEKAGLEEEVAAFGEERDELLAQLVNPQPPAAARPPAFVHGVPLGRQPRGVVNPDTGSVSLGNGYSLDRRGCVHGPDGQVIDKERAARILSAAGMQCAPVA